MSKRKLNQQQKRRIAGNQAKISCKSECYGLVVAHHGKKLEVEDERAQIFNCNKRQNLGIVVPGDKVICQFQDQTGEGVVLSVMPRASLISRPDARKKIHALAANVDQMFIVISPLPAPQQTTIDRYLLAAALENINAILILNKADLLADHPAKQELIDLLSLYRSIGIETFSFSTKDPQFLSKISPQLNDKISIFVGQSGVGKSSIIKQILPQYKVITGELCEQNALGKNTTSTARLYHLANSKGSIIDSPGIREFPLWPLPAPVLANGFVEFRAFIQNCKFRNCLHITEPGCALLNAVNMGKISKARLLSYHILLAEMQDSLKQ